MAVPRFIINNHDYTAYVKAKTGLQWTRENTNAEGAGRDAADVMHPMVQSHQRSLDVTLGPMPFSVARQLEQDLEGNDDGVRVTYPDLYNGLTTTRLFYNTSISSSMMQFRDADVLCDNVKFTLISVKEATV